MPSWETLLRRWWTNKYTLPANDARFQNAYIEDLRIEFMEDLYEADPDEAERAMRTHLATVGRPSGDPLIDHWNRQIARGEVPDLTIGADERAKRRDAAIQAQAQRFYELTGQRIYVPAQHADMLGNATHTQSSLPDLDYRNQSTGATDGRPHVLKQIQTSAFDAFVNAARGGSENRR